MAEQTWLFLDCFQQCQAGTLMFWWQEDSSAMHNALGLLSAAPCLPA